MTLPQSHRDTEKRVREHIMMVPRLTLSKILVTFSLWLCASVANVLL
jgi:hypothetical protein